MTKEKKINPHSVMFIDNPEAERLNSEYIYSGEVGIEGFTRVNIYFSETSAIGYNVESVIHGDVLHLYIIPPNAFEEAWIRLKNLWSLLKKWGRAYMKWLEMVRRWSFWDLGITSRFKFFDERSAPDGGREGWFFQSNTTLTLTGWVRMEAGDGDVFAQDCKFKISETAQKSINLSSADLDKINNFIFCSLKKQGGLYGAFNYE